MLKVIFLLLISLFISDTRQIINPPKIVLITIDGVRWQDMFDAHEGIGNYRPTSRELAPTIYSKFVDNGMAIGKASVATTSSPAGVSMPGYLEIMRGIPSLDCWDNYCKQNTWPTIINNFPNNSAVISGWDTISKVFDNSLAEVNIGREIRSPQWEALGLPDNTNYSEIFGPEYRPDPYTQEAALNYLRIKQPAFLWISLGDTDEYAHENNMLFYWASIKSADEFIEKVMKMTDPNTVFIICPDHGRSEDFQNHGWNDASRRVWIMIAGPGIPKAGFVKYDDNVHLSDIKPTILDIVKGQQSPYSLLNYSK